MDGILYVMSRTLPISWQLRRPLTSIRESLGSLLLVAHLGQDRDREAVGQLRRLGPDLTHDLGQRVRPVMVLLGPIEKLMRRFQASRDNLMRARSPAFTLLIQLVVLVELSQL